MYIYVDLTGMKRWSIGANDKDSEDNFTWVSGISLTHTSWDHNVPDDIGGTVSADCAQYYF